MPEWSDDDTMNQVYQHPPHILVSNYALKQKFEGGKELIWENSELTKI